MKGKIDMAQSKSAPDAEPGADFKGTCRNPNTADAEDDFFTLLEKSGLKTPGPQRRTATGEGGHFHERLRRLGMWPSPSAAPREVLRPAEITGREQERVWAYIEGIARKQAGLTKGSRNDEQNQGAYKAFRLALGVGIPLERVAELLYEANVANGQVADDGEKQVHDTMASARQAAEAAGPEYLGQSECVAPAFTIDAPNDDDGAHDEAAPLFADIAALLAGGLPEPPKPSVLHRDDGAAIFYRGKRNDLYGDPGSAKTMVSLAAAAEELANDGRVVFVDLDNNGVTETVARLLMLGAAREALADQNRFRYCQPDDAAEVLRVVQACAGWATFVILDCVGELLPLFGASSDSADDYTRVMRQVALPLERAGAGVVLLDHQAKGVESRRYGAGGTMAKRRAVTGCSINLVARQPFVPGRGGSAELWVNKDRPGGLAMRCPKPSAGSRRLFAGTFKLEPPGPTGRADWRVLPDRVEVDAAPTLDPVIERHHVAALDFDGAAFSVYELAVRAHGLPDATPPSRAQKKVTARAIDKLVAEGRISLIEGAKPRRWVVAA
ncbi:hypothetical protein [Mycolicibacterium elephantis]